MAGVENSFSRAGGAHTHGQRRASSRHVRIDYQNPSRLLHRASALVRTALKEVGVGRPGPLREGRPIHPIAIADVVNLAGRRQELVDQFTGGDKAIEASLKRMWTEQGDKLCACHEAQQPNCQIRGGAVCRTPECSIQ